MEHEILLTISVYFFDRELPLVIKTEINHSLKRKRTELPWNRFTLEFHSFINYFVKDSELQTDTFQTFCGIG